MIIDLSRAHKDALYALVIYTVELYCTSRTQLFITVLFLPLEYVLYFNKRHSVPYNKYNFFL